MIFQKCLSPSASSSSKRMKPTFKNIMKLLRSKLTVVTEALTVYPRASFFLAPKSVMEMVKCLLSWLDPTVLSDRSWLPLTLSRRLLPSKKS